jgi:hypothetical protein
MDKEASRILPFFWLYLFDVSEALTLSIFGVKQKDVRGTSG